MKTEMTKKDQGEMKYWVTLDERKVLGKPGNEYKATITKNLTTQKQITIPEFAQIVTPPYSYTWSGARFNGKRSNSTWTGQQVFALDFDKGTIPVEEVIDKINQFGFRPQLWYSTFSDTLSIRKFRVVFFLDSVIENIDLHKMIHESLFSLFPDADTSCRDASRYYFGGKECEIIDTDPIPHSQFIDALSIQLYGSDSAKFRKLPLSSEYYTSVQKRALLYTDNTNRHFETECSDTPHTTTDQVGGDLISIDMDKARSQIRILDEFLSGIWLHHMQLFGLATNLIKIRGGFLLMKSTMEKYNKEGKTTYTKNNFNILPYVKKVNYHMVPVYKFSPYLEDSDLFDVISTTRNIRGQIEYEPFEKITLEQAEKFFKEKYKEVILNGEIGKIYLFSMPTAIGKTEKLIGTRATIALPTNDLKNEIAERFSSKSTTCDQELKYSITPDPITFESEELNTKQKCYYRIGMPGKWTGIMHQIIKPGYSEDYSVTDVMLAKNYLAQLQYCQKSTDTILTTHKRALYTTYSNNTLIFDEDPLSSSLEIKQLKISDIFRLNQVVKDPGLESLITFLNDVKPNLIVATPTFNCNIDHLIKRIAVAKVKSNVFEFFNSSFFMRGSGSSKDKYVNECDTIYYINKLEMPKDKRIIIMSATIPIPVYKLLYGDRIVIHAIGDVQQQGKIIQYTKKSCSRGGLKKYGKQISNEVGDKPVITFKKMRKLFQNPVEGIWFGNCSGYDNLKGQDIAVVGTPHGKPLQYLLLAKALGVDFRTTDTTMSYKKIEYNGFRFMMNCFDNEELRRIQLSLIESQLIQAVGRARTLRTNATVEVYSNFPLRISDKFIY